MDKVVLYTTGCPHCKVLEAKLQALKIEFETVTDLNVMLSRGFAMSPMLEVDGVVMDYERAMQWASEQ